jgi:hypothetical protein
MILLAVKRHAIYERDYRQSEIFSLRKMSDVRAVRGGLVVGLLGVWWAGGRGAGGQLGRGAGQGEEKSAFFSAPAFRRNGAETLKPLAPAQPIFSSS